MKKQRKEEPLFCTGCAQKIIMNQPMPEPIKPVLISKEVELRKSPSPKKNRCTINIEPATLEITLNSPKQKVSTPRSDSTAYFTKKVSQKTEYSPDSLATADTFNSSDTKKDKKKQEARS